MSHAGFCLFLILALDPHGAFAGTPAPQGRSSATDAGLRDLAPPRSWVEVIPRRAQTPSLLHTVSTYWVDVKFRPLSGTYFWEAAGPQLGIHQSDDLTKAVACRNFPSIAGRRFCNGWEAQYREGARFVSVYGGVHAELSEILTRQPRPLQFHLGGGMARFQSAFLRSFFAPYFSLEGNWAVLQDFSIGFSAFLAFLDSWTAHSRLTVVDVAAPSLSIEYKF